MGVAAPSLHRGDLCEVEPLAVEPGKFRHVLSHYPTGVVIVAALGEDGRPIGMVVGTFTSVSLDPPLVGFFPAKGSSSWGRIERAGRFCVNVLAGDQANLCHAFASPEGRKFAGIEYALSDGGSPVLPGIVGWIDCTLHEVIDAGDHYLALGRVTALEVARQAEPLLFCKGSLGPLAPSG